jgi:VIT1/CCC1 family predicted Fe2+/Mn2+ transporter
MTAGEYVSVHSQKDTEQADLALERTELSVNDKGEHQELAAIYVPRPRSSTCRLGRATTDGA